MTPPALTVICDDLGDTFDQEQVDMLVKKLHMKSPLTPAFTATEFTQPGGKYTRLVAVRDGEYVGYLAGKFPEGRAFVVIFGALYDGEGIGQQLMNHFANLAVERGFSVLELYVDREESGLTRREDFFDKYRMAPCPDRPEHLCKSLTGQVF
ncbi:GNAT family N-acetyltransferase [Rhodococcus erythropolis]|uniref:GNAT family N-acetyltransferase n=1 Tax=Rhodococcus erythropolis TaxID=1833 RepID=UPI0021089A18|nr:GNAT family N-acetyltransferase [Rhodococcus erythropolis]MCQ4128249.1 GNAT family N-acetyltransferase [Rhodococcus erythropolis]